MKRFALLALVTVTAAAALASIGCGPESPSGSDHPGQGIEHPTSEDTDETDPLEITISAEDVKFAPDELSVGAGEPVTITLVNKDAVEHDLQVDGLMIEQMGATDMVDDHEGADPEMLALHTAPGETAELTFRTDDTGTFEFYCTIPGHREAGMVGTLKVS
jgi:uncharacterized cupredoxin-like copper-binding protein